MVLKNLAGEQFGGECQEDLSSSSEGEGSTLYGGEGKKLSVTGGASDTSHGSEEKGFSLSGSGYQGPQNFTPSNMGVKNPDDITSASRSVPHGK